MKKTYRDAVSEEVARILREERKRKGLSMNTVSERAGLSRMMVSYVERQERNPTLDTLLRLSEALEIDLAELIQRAQRAAARSTSKP